MKYTNRHRTTHHLVLQHRETHNDRYGSQGCYVYSCSVRLLPRQCLKMRKLTETRFSKEEMQRELLENMYRSTDLDELLKESDYTVRRRKECQQMVESLSRASEIVSQVQ